MAVITSSKQNIFKYKNSNGLLNKIPAIIKLFLLLPISIFCMSLPVNGLLIGISTSIIIAFLCKFTIHEQLTDLKPALFYSALMYALSVFSNTFDFFSTGYYHTSAPHSPPSTCYLLPAICYLLTPNSDFLRIALRLILIIQISALFFRSTSAIEIRDSLCLIELFIRKILRKIFGKRVSYKCIFSQNISLFLSFIPEIFSAWSSINLAWKARGGKNNFSKITTTVFVLISLSFEKAAVKQKALFARGG